MDKRERELKQQHELLAWQTAHLLNIQICEAGDKVTVKQLMGEEDKQSVRTSKTKIDRMHSVLMAMPNVMKDTEPDVQD